MDSFAAEIGVVMHGVRLNVRSNYAKWLDHSTVLLGDHAGAPTESPQLVVTGDWRSAKPGEPEEMRGSWGKHYEGPL